MTHKDFLFYVLDILDYNKIPYVLFAGTLLGAVRENNFLSNDVKDTDIAVDEKYYWEIRRIFDYQVSEKQCKWGAILRKELSVHSMCCNYKVDIFAMETVGNKYAVYSYKPNCQDKKWNHEWRAFFTKEYFFPEKQIDFLGRKVSIPNNEDKVLKEEYGDWRNPKPEWVSSDNTVLNADKHYPGFYPAGLPMSQYKIDLNQKETGFICINFLRKDCTKKCIKSLKENYPNVKVYVADQDEPTGEMIQFYEQNNVEYYYLPYDCGLSVCRNFLVEKVKEPYLMWGDNDFIFDKKANINHGITILEQDKTIGFVGGSITKNGHIQHYERFLAYMPEHKLLVYIPLELTNPKPHAIKNITYYDCDMTFNYVVCPTKMIQENEKLRWHPELKVRYEHSIMPNQPIIIRRNNNIEIVSIGSLIPPSKLYSPKQTINKVKYYQPNIEIWTQHGWERIKTVIAHKNINPIYNLLTRNGYIECTSDHSLIINNKPILPTQLKINDKIELLPYPKLSNSINADLEWAWLLGFFLAEGHCAKKERLNTFGYEWSITNQNKNLLLKCKKILEKFGIESHILNTKKRKDKCFFLYLKKPKKMNEYFLEFYEKNIKKIPSYIFKFSKEARIQFFQGFMLGDGSQLHNRTHIIQKSELVIQGFIYLLQDIYPYYSLYKQQNKYGSWFKCELFTNEKQKNKRWKLILANKNILKSITKQKFDGFVYDICTDSKHHSFSGGIGNVNLHNSDMFLSINQFSGKRVVYCPSMQVIHEHDHSNKQYNEYRMRSFANQIFAKKWGLKMNFTIGHGAEVYHPQELFTEQELIKKILK